VEDDHVDRPGVEERQRLKLTGTNSSIGLIVLIPNIHPTKSDGLPALTHERPLQAYAPRGRRTTGDAQSRLRASPVGKTQTSPWHRKQLLDFEHAFRRPGGYGGAAAPDPIPNSAVKRSSADGTSSQDAGE
jgi:hypothetical protein